MPFNRDQFEVTQYLGTKVGKQNPFMREIACMDSEWREIRSYLEMIEIIDKYELELPERDKKDFKMLKEMCTIIGQAKFKMDVVTHLAMKLGKPSKVEDFDL